MTEQFYLTFAIEKVKVEGAAESELGQGKVSVQIFCSDESHFTLVGENVNDFGRQISFHLGDLHTGLEKYFPTRLVVLQDDIRIGEADLSQLVELKSEIAEENLDWAVKSKRTDCKLLRKVDDGLLDQNLVGVVRLFIAVEKREGGAMPCNLEPPPGLFSASDESIPLTEEDSCLIVCDQYIKFKEICGPCGRPDCPVAQLIKEELRKICAKASVSTVGLN